VPVPVDAVDFRPNRSATTSPSTMQRSSSTSSPTRTGCRSRRTSPRPRSGQRSAELWAHRTLDAGGAYGYCCVRHGTDGACARREAAGGRHRVTVWNRTKGKAGELVAAGAREADHHPGHDDAIRAVAFSELRSSIGEATTSVDSSMVSPRLSGELAEASPGSSPCRSSAALSPEVGAGNVPRRRQGPRSWTAG
jgi:hypothetical protein